MKRTRYIKPEAFVIETKFGYFCAGSGDNNKTADYTGKGDGESGTTPIPVSGKDYAKGWSGDFNDWDEDNVWDD